MRVSSSRGSAVRPVRRSDGTSGHGRAPRASRGRRRTARRRRRRPSGSVEHEQRLADDVAGDRAAVGGQQGEPAPAVREHVPRGAGAARRPAARRPASGPAPGRTAAPSRRRPGVRARRPPAAAGPCGRSAQSCSRPLWLNSQRSWVNGAAPPRRPTPAVAERTAATTQDVGDRRRQGRERRVGPDRLGPAIAHRLGAVDVPAGAEAVGVHGAVPLPPGRPGLPQQRVRRGR